MLVDIIKHNSHIIISDFIYDLKGKEHYIKQVYIGYTKKECYKKFIDYINNDSEISNNCNYHG